MRAQPIAQQPEEAPVPESAVPFYFITMPGSSYKAISDAAAKRNMTVPELVSQAISKFLQP